MTSPIRWLDTLKVLEKGVGTLAVVVAAAVVGVDVVVVVGV
jgi:hypothetical protein